MNDTKNMGVEIGGRHGHHLLSSFIHCILHQRTDSLGGSLPAQARLNAARRPLLTLMTLDAIGEDDAALRSRSTMSPPPTRGIQMRRKGRKG